MAFRIHPRVAWQVLDGEAVLIDLDGGRTLGLNETGSFLWSRLGRGDETALARDLAESYQVTEEQAREDVRAFLELLRGRGFVEP